MLSSLFGQETAIKAKIGFLSANEIIAGFGWKKIHKFGSDCGSRASAERRDLNTASVSSFALGNGVYFKPKYEFLNKIWLSWSLLDSPSDKNESICRSPVYAMRSN